MTELPPASRNSDPATSKYADLFLPRQRRIVEAFAAIAERVDGEGLEFTDSDLAKWTGWDRNIAARRRLDLEAMDLVETVVEVVERTDGGEHYRVVTRTGPAGRAEQVYRLTPDGLVASGNYYADAP